MANPIQFKSGEFYGDLHHGARGSVFDIRRLSATRSEDEVETHRHDDAHFVLVLSGVYISSALHAPAHAPSPTLVFNPAGTTHRDRFLDGKGSFLTVSLDPALLSGAEELQAAQEQATVLAAPTSVAAAFRIAREIGRGGDVALLEAGAWEVLASLQRAATKSRAPCPPGPTRPTSAVMDMAADTHCASPTWPPRLVCTRCTWRACSARPGAVRRATCCAGDASSKPAACCAVRSWAWPMWR